MPESKTQNKYARPEGQAGIPARRPHICARKQHMYARPEGQANTPQGLELHLVSPLFPKRKSGIAWPVAWGITQCVMPKTPLNALIRNNTMLVTKTNRGGRLTWSLANPPKLGSCTPSLTSGLPTKVLMKEEHRLEMMKTHRQGRMYLGLASRSYAKRSDRPYSASASKPPWIDGTCGDPICLPKNYRTPPKEDC